MHVLRRCYEDICGKQYTTDEASSASHDKVVSSQSGSSSEGGVPLKNPHITYDMEDILYHLALGNKSHDLVEMFGDVKVTKSTIFQNIQNNDKKYRELLREGLKYGRRKWTFLYHSSNSFFLFVNNRSLFVLAALLIVWNDSLTIFYKKSDIKFHPARCCKT